jgi:hypothetical protein
LSTGVRHEAPDKENRRGGAWQDRGKEREADMERTDWLDEGFDSGQA